MHSKLVWSFLSLVTLAAGGLISGCDSDAKIAKSGVGESCDNTADCNDGLKCIQGACYKSASGSGGSENQGGEGSGATGTGATGPVPPVLGGEGESCTKRADCKDGLGCFNQRCTKDSGGEGGEGNVPGVKLGQLGETCQTSADCEDELSCVPGGIGENGPYGYVGVCSRTTGRLTVTGKMCGAECKEAADCCELPLQLHVPYAAVDTPGTSGPYGTGANSCSELRDLIGTVDCETTVLPAQQARCFALAAYCECGKNTWACESGQCVYGDECTASGAKPGGCPSYTRSGRVTVSTCNEDSACAPEPVEVTGCDKDADCDGGTTVEGYNCTEGECTCYKETGACYRKCDNNLDCAVGRVCDDETSVCVLAPSCETNEQCAVRNGDPRYECIEQTCQMRCNTDFDCNGGEYYGMTTPICGEDKLCHPIGCSTDDDCSTGTSPAVRLFCTEPVEVEGAEVVESAITD